MEVLGILSARYCGNGVTRHVFLVGSIAIKVPRINYGWVNFLQGMIANIQEKRFSSIEGALLAPVIFSIPLGMVNVMPRCNPLSENEWSQLKEHIKNCDKYLGAELKRDSFGWLGGVVVAVDYGS